MEIEIDQGGGCGAVGIHGTMGVLRAVSIVVDDPPVSVPLLTCGIIGGIVPCIDQEHRCTIYRALPFGIR